MTGVERVGSSNKKKKAEAKWIPETEGCFISLMYHEVVMGNRIGDTFNTHQWNEIFKKLNERCSMEPQYEMNQLMSKQGPMKKIWRRFHNMLTNITVFGWDKDLRMITGGEDVRGRWLEVHKKNKYMKKRSCLHYNELTTIFFDSTATDSGALASTQPPQGRSRVRRSVPSIPENDVFCDNNANEMYTPDNNCSS